MRIQLERKWVDRLLQMPESGMGYQRVRVRLTDGRDVCGAMVYNSELLDLPESAGAVDAADIAAIELEPSPARDRSPD